MPTPAQIAELTRRSNAAASIVENRLRILWQALGVTDPASTTAALLEAVPGIVDAGADLAATIAADWYDDVRVAQQITGTYSASLAPPLPGEQIDAMVRWAVTPLWTDDNLDASLANLLAGADRLTRNSGRSTITLSTAGDPAALGYVRVPRPGACEFCLMLASRGAVYTSEAAGELVGFAGHTRGTQQAGERFHDHCHCTTSPVWTPDDVPPLNRALEQQWAEVTAGLYGDDARDAWAAHVAGT